MVFINLGQKKSQRIFLENESDIFFFTLIIVFYEQHMKSKITDKKKNLL